MTISSIFLLAATICLGLMAGLFYAYSCSVMPGLSRLQDQQYISAMQSINRAIQNPVFFMSFFGVLILLPITTYLKYSQPISTVFWYILAATIIYLAGAFLVTIFGNIPLNNTLDRFDLMKASEESIKAQREIFETKWNTLNNIRTLASFLSFICALVACLKNYEVKSF